MSRPADNAIPASSRQGVVYADGASPSFSRVAPSLAEQRLVVAADGGYHSAVAHGVKVDVLIGDFDSLSSTDIPSSIQQISFSPDKDATDTELAIDYCRNAGCSSLLLIGGGGGSIDHFLAIVWLFEGNRRLNRWINDSATIDYVDDYWERTDCQVGELISILPIGRSSWRLRSNGLRWPLDKIRWRRDNTGIRNEAAAKAVSIAVQRGALLVIHRFSQ